MEMTFAEYLALLAGGDALRTKQLEAALRRAPTKATGITAADVEAALELTSLDVT
jgi:hypothetical protein